MNQGPRDEKLVSKEPTGQRCTRNRTPTVRSLKAGTGSDSAGPKPSCGPHTQKMLPRSSETHTERSSSPSLATETQCL